MALPGAVLALAAGLLLIGLAWPRFTAAVALIPGRAVLDGIGRGEPADAAALQKAAGAHVAALRVLPDAAGNLGLGELRFEQGLAGGDSSQTMAVFAESRRALEAAVELGPGDPFAWLWLAYATLFERRDDHVAARYLAVSLSTGPYSSGLLVRRFELGLALWGNLGAAECDAMAEQARALARLNPYSLAVAARKAHAVSFVRQSLAEHENLLAAFDRNLVVLPPQQDRLPATSP
ncbi:MAG TPA: hypothetical protein VEU47_08705 [Candidatus Cybelea sp.]|nr:hypothetical protein [Candidatus Cybelea sp.]